MVNKLGLLTWKRGPRRGEVPHLPVVKKYLSSQAIPGTRDEVQKCNRAVAKHAHKQSFVFFVVPMKLRCSSVAVANKTSV